MMNWYNFRTGQEETNIVLTDENATDYVPQIGGVGMYRIFRQMGLSIDKALLNVLSRAAGKAYPFPVNFEDKNETRSE